VLTKKSEKRWGSEKKGGRIKVRPELKGKKQEGGGERSCAPRTTKWFKKKSGTKGDRLKEWVEKKRGGAGKRKMSQGRNQRSKGTKRDWHKSFTSLGNNTHKKRWRTRRKANRPCSLSMVKQYSSYQQARHSTPSKRRCREKGGNAGEGKRNLVATLLKIRKKKESIIRSIDRGFWGQEKSRSRTSGGTNGKKKG